MAAIWSTMDDAWRNQSPPLPTRRPETKQLAMKHLMFLLVSLATTTVLAAEPEVERKQLEFFEKQVRPLLAERCFKCHSATKQESSLRVDHLRFLKHGGDSGPAIVPGKPDESLLIQAVRYDGDYQMPPTGKLPQKEIATLEKWVAIGAPWPQDDVPQAVAGEGGFTEEDRNYWCFQPLADPQPPAVDDAWVRNDIDRFVAQKHAELGLTPAAEADRRELVRRVYFDLHGLPPTPAEIEAFVSDDDQNAYEKLVDRLLASPRYGERWAQHWLDLVRYAESDGYNADGYRESVWTYRDYVIQSFNVDKPYYRYVREQLAGDEMAPDDPEVMIGTAYLRHPVYEWNQRDVRGQWEIILTDMTDTSGELFLGLSFGCARCHNHKFDPILQKDYYRLKAFFTPVLWRDDLKLATPQQRARHDEQQAAWEAATSDIRAEIAGLTEPLVQPRVERALTRFTDELQLLVRKEPDERGPLERQLARLCERQMEHERKTFDAAKSIKDDKAKARYKELEAELKKFDHLKPKPLMEAFVATDAAATGPPNLLKTRKGEEDVAPGFLTLLAPGEPEIEPLENSTGRRTALANWITRPDNPLSTRVIVNRIWQYHFGRGIVATSSDFGRLGEKPTHPELLDWLTRRFVAGGWRFKSLHRDIVLSATYRQTARRQPPDVAQKIDPTNKYLWRFSPRRLDAEQIRDAMLAASGELDLTAGGPAEDANSNRRTIYTRKKRNTQNDLLRSLDAPAGFFSTAERQSTVTPTQALLLVNGEWTLARAAKLAQRAKTVDDAWLYTFGRLPSDGERQAAQAFLQKRTSGEVPTNQPTAAATETASQFKLATPHERLLAETPEKEGDEFTVEAVFELHSVDANAAPRTIASRWNGGKDSIESFGWCLAVTGEKSRYTPRSVIVQLVGEDENANIAYEVAPSHLRIELGRRYHVAATISCSEHTVHFRLQDLSQPESAVRTALAKHAVRSKLCAGQSALVIGGLSKRAPPYQWDGRIEALRVVSGALPSESFMADPQEWQAGLVHWIAAAGDSSSLTWSGSDSPSETVDARRQAMHDLCHVLLNSNEFFYLH
jgi:hypothetical protein